MFKHPSHEAVVAGIRTLSEVQDTPAGNEVAVVGIVFDVADDPFGPIHVRAFGDVTKFGDRIWSFWRCWWVVEAVGGGAGDKIWGYRWVVEVVGGGAEGVDF